MIGFIYTKREYEAVKAYIKAITKIEKLRRERKVREEQGKNG